ncbi:CBS domain-containing protein, partial [Neisseria meningitidis]
HADIHITASVSQEACPLGLAPTTSTTAVMALGDALAVVLLRARAFTPDDFALSHPAGSLGKRLLLRVADIMHKGGGLPAVRLGTPLKEAIVSMSEKGLGMLAVTDGQGRLKGVFTDGDLRRLFQECDNFTGLSIDEVMHTHPKTIAAERLATEALKVMQANHVNGLLVTDADGVLIGALNMHDLLAARIV